MNIDRSHRCRVMSSSPASSLISYSYLVLIVTIVVCGLVPSTRVVRADVFTALVDLELLLEAEKSISVDLRQYVAKENERLHQLSRYVI
jgi:hypothetical protein